MVVTVITIILAVGLVLVSVAAVGAMLWMRNNEQKRELVVHNADALTQLNHALNDAIKELNRVNHQLQAEMENKQRSLFSFQSTSTDVPLTLSNTANNPALTDATDAVEIIVPIKRGRGRPRKTPMVVNTPTELQSPTADASAISNAAPPAPDTTPTPKPIPRKFKGNEKHRKVINLHEQGLSTADIAKKLSIGQGEVTLILEKAEQRS